MVLLFFYYILFNKIIHLIIYNTIVSKLFVYLAFTVFYLTNIQITNSLFIIKPI
jgi:hypothetical protein